MAQSIEEVEQAFMSAHKAGDTEAAKALAGEVERMRGAATTAPATPAPPVEKEKESALEDFGEGVWSSMLGTGYGIKEIFSELSEEDKARLKDWQDDAAESGWGTAGRVVGEIGQIVAPGAAAGKLLKGAGKGAKLVRALTKGLKGDVAMSALHGGLTLPSEGQDRLSSALLSGGGALVGGGLGKAIGKVPLFKGVEKTKEGAEQLEMGIPLLAGDASKSSLPKAMDYMAKFLPVTAKGMREMKDEALGQWNKVSFNKARPPGSADITEAGHKGMRQLKAAFDSSYDSAWGKATKPSNEGLTSMADEAVNAGKTLGGTAPASAKKVLADLKTLSKDFTPGGLKSFDNLLRKRIESAYKGNELDLGEALNGIRTTLRASVGPEVIDDLAKVDSKYGEYLTLKYAAGTSEALDVAGLLNPKVLKAGVKKAGEGRESFGMAPNQPWLDASMKTLGRKEPNPIIDMLKGLSQNVWSPTGAMDVGRRGMLGELPVQAKLRPLADALRKSPVSAGQISGGTVGGY